MEAKPTNVNEFLGDLYGGIFIEKVSRALSTVAEGVVINHKEGKITLEFTLKQIEDSAQITVSHKISYKKPTATGDQTETDKTSTPMFVNQGGEITQYPKDQFQMAPKASAADYLKTSTGE